MQVPIESADIRYVYLLEKSGRRLDSQPRRDPYISKLRRKIVDRLKAKAALLQEQKS